MSNITLQEISERLANNYYNPTEKRPIKPEGYENENYVYDEEKSVRWNREHREELELAYKAELMNYKASERNKGTEFQYDLERALHYEYGINAAQFKHLFSEAGRITDTPNELIWKLQELTELYLALKQEEME